MKRFVLFIWLAGMAAILSGCMVGADFEPPSVPEATGYTRTPVPKKTTPVPTEFGNVLTTAIAQAQIHERIRIDEDTLALQAEQLKITRERFELGVISKQEVKAASKNQ